jgi:hypothetical protein
VKPFVALPLRPLSIGELLDRALTVYRTQFRELFLLALCFQVVLHAATKLFELLAFASFPLLVQPRALAERPSLEALGSQLHWALPAVLSFTGFSLMVWQLSVAAVSASAETAVSARPLSALAAWRALRPRLLPLVATLTLELLLMALHVLAGTVPLVVTAMLALRDPSPVALALLAVGGGLSLLLMPGLFLVALLKYLLVPAVVQVEGFSGWGAIRRASALMEGRPSERLAAYPKMRGSLVMLVLGLATNAILLVATAPRALLLVADAGRTANAPGLLAVELFEVLASSAVAPFGMVAIALFYLDVRVRREGLDLAMAANRLASSA